MTLFDLAWERWRSGLNSTQRAEADRLLAQFNEAGCQDDPEGWVRSEVNENIPQLARFCVLRSLWQYQIDRFLDDPSWMDWLVEESQKRPSAYFADTGQTVKRLLAAGVDRSDIGRIARFAAYEAAFWRAQSDR